jgi:hypothetical protein
MQTSSSIQLEEFVLQVRLPFQAICHFMLTSID